MKSILFIHQGGGIGGASLCLKELLDELKGEYKLKVLCIYQSDAVEYFRKSGYDTDVLTSSFYRKFYKYFYHSEAFSYTPSKVVGFIRAFISYVCNLYFADKVLSNYKPDLVHLNSSVLTDWAIVAKKRGIKVVIHVREPIAKGYFGLRRAFLRRVIRKYTDHVIAISKDNSNRLGLPIKTTIIYDPIRSLPITKTKDTASGLHYYSYFGGTQEIKGFYVLAEALKYLDSNIRIYFGGYFYKNPNNSGIMYQIKKLIKLALPVYRKWFKCIQLIENSEKVIILGVVDNVYNYIHQSDALLFPSTRPHFADPVLEAYKIGKPVIVSDVEGMNEIVSSETGLLFKRNNAKSLASAINLMSRMNAEQVELYRKNCLLKSKFITETNGKVINVVSNLIG